MIGNTVKIMTLPKKIHGSEYYEVVSRQCLTGNGTLFVIQQMIIISLGRHSGVSMPDLPVNGLFRMCGLLKEMTYFL
jgi:hypothetical protein